MKTKRQRSRRQRRTVKYASRRGGRLHFTRPRHSITKGFYKHVGKLHLDSRKKYDNNHKRKINRDKFGDYYNKWTDPGNDSLFFSDNPELSSSLKKSNTSGSSSQIPSELDAIGDVATLISQPGELTSELRAKIKAAVKKVPYFTRKVGKFAIPRFPDEDIPWDRKDPKFMYAMGQL